MTEREVSLCFVAPPGKYADSFITWSDFVAAVEKVEFVFMDGSRDFICFDCVDDNAKEG